MSTAHFGNHPCMHCGTDTLHIAGKCFDCGAIQPLPGRAYQEAHIERPITSDLWKPATVVKPTNNGRRVRVLTSARA